MGLWFRFKLHHIFIDNFRIEKNELTFNDEIKAVVDVTNTGNREGKEVIQLYVRDEYCSVLRPIKELKSFRKIDLAPGETKTVELSVKLRDCGYYNNKGNYLLEPGTFKIMVGTASDDIKYEEVVTVN